MFVHLFHPFAFFAAACLVQGATGKPRESLQGAFDILTAEYYDGLAEVDSFTCDSRCPQKIDVLQFTEDQLLKLKSIVDKVPRDTKQLKESLDKFARSLPKKVQEQQQANLKQLQPAYADAAKQRQTAIKTAKLNKQEMNALVEITTLCVRNEVEKLLHVNVKPSAVLEEMHHKFQDKRTVFPCFDELNQSVMPLWWE